MQLTPMMQQYMEIKEKHQDCILFFRLGDFYEMFFEDAITASKEMEITLTGKSCGQDERAPMCGVPYHAADTYIAKLIDKGYKVAICEQVEDPATAKGIVKREVVQIITPGTVVSQTMLNEKENNYLASIFLEETGAGIAYCDISTGEIKTTELNGQGYIERLINELVKIKAKEIIANEYTALDGLFEEIKVTTGAYISILNDNYYSKKTAEKFIFRQFKVKSLKGIGVEDVPNAVSALGALLSYLFETQKQNLSHINFLNVYDTSGYMTLDKSTIKNLELTETLFEKKVQGSLLGVLDKTHTAMGSRKLKYWLREPLNNLNEIYLRLSSVHILSENVIFRNNLIEYLKRIYDIERLSGRIACGNANGKDLIALLNSIIVLPDIKSELLSCGDPLLESLEEKIDSLTDVYNIIKKAIVDEPPFTIKEGGIIRDGYSEELDQLKNSIKDGQRWIANLEGIEKERTGIKSLKVGFNKVFGYYIEVTKSYFDLIPDNYIRKQTLANCERFITPELKEVETVVLSAETKINQMEYDIFIEIRSFIQGYISTIQSTSGAVSTLDVLVSFAEVSSRLGYVRPVVNDGNIIKIEKGRHPVIEQTIKDGIFVSNDTYIDGKDNSMLLITGPNMAGKSTYMRQTALIVLMAQVGCFVPAEAADIGIVDRIYTRIGASDNLSQGQSTFFVEMSELAYILNTASRKSLIILDEIGRGTSTYDGLSIAWAVVEYLCNKKCQTRTLFATHYHELTSLEGSIKGIKNLNVDVQDKDGNIVFLHKIVEGSASRSYGIHVAKLAGVPKSLLIAAEEKLQKLEENKVNIDLEKHNSQISENKFCVRESDTEQITFFSFAPNPVVERLRNIDLLNITPSQAFGILEELKKAAEK